MIDAVKIGDRLQLAEVSIRRNSRFAGMTLAESGIGERSGANVIGIWARGEFIAAPPPDSDLVDGSILLVSGRTDQLEQLAEMTQASVRGFAAGQTAVIGYGEVGKAVSTELEEAGLPYEVIDQDGLEGVDVVGDATDPETLISAGVKEADTVVLALPDDTMTEFVTLVIRDVAPDTQILARVEQQANVSKTYRAGADYVLSLARVTGRMSASQLLANREVVSPEQQVNILRKQAQGLVGVTIGEANIRDRTRCTVIAIERDEGVISDIGPDTAIKPGDVLVIIGTDEAINLFEQTFQSATG